MTSTPAWLRRAGRLDLGGGETVLWSVAEGRRGRRWRSLRLDADGHVISDLLLELDPTGSWTRLELATAAGILTLHPEPDERATHGNVVTPSGVRHLALEWGRDHRLVIEGEPVAVAALGRPHEDTAPAPGLVVDTDLAVTAVRATHAPARPPDGLPGPSWPLEV